MRGASAGIVGAFAANRPFLSSGLLLAGLSTLLVIAFRRTDADALISAFAANGLVIIAAPMAFVATAPRRGAFRILHALAFVGLVLFLLYGAPGEMRTLPGLSPAAVLAAVGLYLFMSALSPLGGNVARLAALAPLGALIGAAGACGYLAIEGLLDSPAGSMAAGVALALGLGAGANVAADFAKIFTAGESRRRAAAAAGHGAVATSAFSLMAIAAAFGVYSYSENFGAIDPLLVWAAVTIASSAMVMALVIVAGGLALSRVGERAALEENRRRRWFAAAWRPVRLALPASTATAAIAIAAILVVVAVFESNASTPVSLIAFIILIWIASAIAFVSLRTSTMIAMLLAASAILADYALSAIGVGKVGLAEKLAGLTLAAAALGHMTQSWRDAQERWRSARDVVEEALSDGLRRFLFVVGPGAAALFVAAQSFKWAGGAVAIIYFLTVSLIALALSPAAMTAMSARVRL